MTIPILRVIQIFIEMISYFLVFEEHKSIRTAGNITLFVPLHPEYISYIFPQTVWKEEPNLKVIESPPCSTVSLDKSELNHVLIMLIVWHAVSMYNRGPVQTLSFQPVL